MVEVGDPVTPKLCANERQQQHSCFTYGDFQALGMALPGTASKPAATRDDPRTVTEQKRQDPNDFQGIFQRFLPLILYSTWMVTAPGLCSCGGSTLLLG